MGNYSLMQEIVSAPGANRPRDFHGGKPRRVKSGGLPRNAHRLGTINHCSPPTFPAYSASLSSGERFVRRERSSWSANTAARGVESGTVGLASSTRRAPRRSEAQGRPGARAALEKQQTFRPPALNGD